ncbi:MAG: transglutaminase family protein [Flavitalea sp.]
MNYTITHKTAYTYFEPVSLCHNIVKLIPRTTDLQVCKASRVKIYPQPDVLNEYIDFFGNKVIYFSIEKEHKQLTVNVTSEIERALASQAEALAKSGIRNNITIEAVKLSLLDLNLESAEISQYIFETPMTAWNEEIKAYALQSFSPGRSFFDAARELMHRIYTDFEFKSGFTTIATPLSTVMQQRKGVCQDFAHLAIACIRSAGLPARYVSGYIETISPAGLPRLTGVDASHAWFSVYIPGMGWTDFDPTNNKMPAEQHITIGWGRDYMDIAPLTGIILSSGRHKLTVSVDVRREI